MYPGTIAATIAITRYQYQSKYSIPTHNFAIIKANAKVVNFIKDISYHSNNFILFFIHLQNMVITSNISKSKLYIKVRFKKRE